jgi:hypothetical protein
MEQQRTTYYVRWPAVLRLRLGTPRMRPAYTSMTLGNMRASGVRTIAAYCQSRSCHHSAVIDVSDLSNDVEVPAIGSRLRCTACGRLGAESRPN